MSWRFEAIGTPWRIEAPGGPDEDARAAVLARIDAFDRTWSRFRDDSLVTEIAAAAGRWTLPDEAVPLLELYRRLHDLTDGAVTPLVGRTLADLGYDAGYSLRPSAAPAAVPGWSSIRWEPPELVTSEPVLLDVGAAGKGLLADLVADVLSGPEGLPVTVDASGDVVHRGTEPLRVALEHPHDPQMAVGVVELAPGTALCASAVNRRAWGDGLHHVLDGRTGEPTRDVVATWVVADSGLVADGAATAAFFVPPAELDPALGVASVRMTSAGRLEWSPAFPGELFV